MNERIWGAVCGRIQKRKKERKKGNKTSSYTSIFGQRNTVMAGVEIVADFLSEVNMLSSAVHDLLSTTLIIVIITNITRNNRELVRQVDWHMSKASRAVAPKTNTGITSRIAINWLLL
jgi:hypothetical protein